jgi:phage protein D
MVQHYKPAARIEINGKDVTKQWSDVLDTMTVTDEAGIKSDTLEVSFDNATGFSAPPIGAEIKAWLGYEPSPVYMGSYKIDSWTKSGPLRRLTISAKAADLTSKIRSPKMRSWHEKTVKEIVTTIAGDNGLSAIVDSQIGANFIEHIDQQTESDVAFLTRLAKRQGATFKLADGKVLFAAKGSSTAPSGKSKSAKIIVPEQLSTWSVTCDKRGDFDAATAQYRDPTTKKRKTVTAGGGSRKHRDRHLYGSQAEAQAAAKAKLGDLTRGQKSVQLDGPGNPDLFAEALVTLKGFDPDVDGQFLAKSVTHAFSASGFTTSATLETEGKSGT